VSHIGARLAPDHSRRPYTNGESTVTDRSQ